MASKASVCRAILVLNVLYCSLAVVQDGLPGWHMFESVEYLGHALSDRENRAMDVRDWLPHGANLVDKAELRKVVRFVCKREQARGPFTYVEEDSGVTLDNRCNMHENR